jgi:ankyrin repeat protein
MRNYNRSKTPLINLIDKGDFKGLIRALENGADPTSERTESGVTPLYAAMNKRNHEMVEALLLYGANPNDPPDLLHAASIRPNVKMVNLLVKYGADINKKNNKGKLPINKATEWGHTNVARYLQGQSKKQTTGIPSEYTIDEINGPTLLNGFSTINPQTKNPIIKRNPTNDPINSNIVRKYTMKNNTNKNSFNNIQETNTVSSTNTFNQMTSMKNRNSYNNFQSKTKKKISSIKRKTPKKNKPTKQNPNKNIKIVTIEPKKSHLTRKSTTVAKKVHHFVCKEKKKNGHFDCVEE